MKYLENFNDYNRTFGDNVEKLSESLTLWYDTLLSSISAEKLDIIDEFKLIDDSNLDNMERLTKNTSFINSLSSLGLRKSEVKKSDDYETFLNKPCRFMFIYDENAIELENPLYLLIQSWNDSLSEWSLVDLYKVNDDAKKFYDKLTSKTIELKDGDNNYIYQTTNGNEWVLQNIQKSNDIFKKVLRSEELEEILRSEGIILDIV